MQRLKVFVLYALLLSAVPLYTIFALAYSLSDDDNVIDIDRNTRIVDSETQVVDDEIEIDNAYNIFQDFEELDDNNATQLVTELIDNEQIKGIAKSENELYIISNNGGKYIVNLNENTLGIVGYAELNNIEIKNIKLPEIKSDGSKGQSQKLAPISDAFGAIIGMCLVIFIGLFLYKRSAGTKSIVTYSTNGQSPKTDTPSEKIVKTEDGIEIPRVKFDDVEGVDELKEDIFRLVDCLKHPEKYENAGARIPKGVILYGPPGTGKTLLAKAIAGEAGVPFLAAVGSDFVEKYVGVGAKRVRELYSKAKKKAPCIVFIDEVDAVAGKRGEENNSENDQTINALLSELDGFGSTSKIITICATNRLDMLDSAFTRAGRFDLKLAVGLPDKDSRLRILKIHSKNKKLSEDIDLKALANKTSGFSGAELEALLNEAAMLAAGNDRVVIYNNDIDDAFFKIIMQGNKKKREKIDKMNKLVAWHESGHTLAARLLTDDIVNSVTIIGSSSGAGGVTFRTPRDEGLQSKKYLRESIAVMYAGRAAEEIYLGDKDEITTGASQDIKQATSIIKQYLATYGMGDIGMIDITQLNRDFNNIVSEASKLAKEIYEKTLLVLRDNKKILEDLANNLIKEETLDEVEIERIIKRHKVKLEVKL